VNQPTIYWHDYETFGADPRRDRAAQFAGIRTSEDLEIIGEPNIVYCRPANDMLPHPEACLITGITPQFAFQNGECEAEFIRQIHQLLATPGTCGAGYNSIRFDDEITRHALYRNFFDPYAREWQYANSRWDIIDMVRLTRALRPDGIEWPTDSNGSPSFRLEELSAANGIEHKSAHDALSDVYATIELAKLIRIRNPRLYTYSYNHRQKKQAAKLIKPGSYAPVLHVSGRYPAADGCIAMVAPLAWHPSNQNGVIVYDLSKDPQPLLELSAEEISDRLFTASENLPVGIARIPLKTIHINKCPVVVPVSTLRSNDAERLQIDTQQCLNNLDKIKAAIGLEAKLAKVFGSYPGSDCCDPDLMLYSGGFFNDSDKAEMSKIRSLDPLELRDFQPKFQDKRLAEMLFRFRSRNYPETLSAEDTRNWNTYRAARIHQPEGNGSIQFKEFCEIIREKRADSTLDNKQKTILDELEAWGNDVA